IPMRVLIDGELRSGRFLTVVAANATHFGGGMRVAPQAELDDGQLDVVLAGDLGKRESLLALAKLYRGTHVNGTTITTQRARVDAAGFAAMARASVAERERQTLRRVINATGVVLQTNLGRAPLSARALAAIIDAAGAVSVEYDLALGKRGERHGHAARLLADLAGSEDALVANNNAAAVLLALAALAARKEVIVARGELVEIGGGFRIPDVLRRSGAKLVEVGTTNRTYARDYAGAISERTAAVLRLLASNLKLIGFVARPEGRELAALARERPVWRMLAASEQALAARADAIVSELARLGVPAKVVKTESAVGGGSLPEETQPSRAVALDLPAASRAAAVLRAADPPVVARIVDDRVALDLRSVLPEDDG